MTFHYPFNKGCVVFQVFRFWTFKVFSENDSCFSESEYRGESLGFNSKLNYFTFLILCPMLLFVKD